MVEQRFRLARTGRGALVRAKRWFYANFYTKAHSEIKELNKKSWTEVARKLVDEMNKRNLGDKPTRLTLNYETGNKGEFKPISVTVEVMELKPVDKFTIYLTQESKEAEKELVKQQLAEIIKKAKEMGIDLDQLKQQS